MKTKTASMETMTEKALTITETGCQSLNYSCHGKSKAPFCGSELEGPTRNIMQDLVKNLARFLTFFLHIL